MLTSPAHLQGKRCCVVPNVAVDYMALNGQHLLVAWRKSCHRMHIDIATHVYNFFSYAILEYHLVPQWRLCLCLVLPYLPYTKP